MSRPPPHPSAAHLPLAHRLRLAQRHPSPGLHRPTWGAHLQIAAWPPVLGLEAVAGRSRGAVVQTRGPQCGTDQE